MDLAAEEARLKCFPCGKDSQWTLLWLQSSCSAFRVPTFISWHCGQMRDPSRVIKMHHGSLMWEWLRLLLNVQWLPRGRGRYKQRKLIHTLMNFLIRIQKSKLQQCISP